MKRVKRIVSLLLAAMTLFTMLAVYPVKAEAAIKRTEQVSFGGTSNAASQCVYLYLPTKVYLDKNYTPQTAKAAVYNKSSKKETKYLIVLRFKEKKKAHLKIRYKEGSKYEKEDIYVTPTEYKSPAKSVKIGKQLYFTGNTWAITKNETLKGKLNIKLKKDWTIYAIGKYNINNFYNPKYTYYKNGSNIKVNKNERLIIMFQNKKTNKIATMMYDCYFNHSYSS